MLYLRTQSFFRRTLIFFSIIVPGIPIISTGCRAGGPPYRKAPPGRPAPILGSYFFSPEPAPYRRFSMGEARFRPGRSNRETYFKLQIIGGSRSGSIRLHSYEGRARIIEDILELRSEDCTVFGKRGWTENFAPLQGWTCDHLIFSFAYTQTSHTTNHIAKKLQRISGPRSTQADSIMHFHLRRAPLAHKAGRDFVGRIVSVLPDRRIIVWGIEAARRLRRAQIFDIFDTGGRAVGQARMTLGPGDTIISVILRNSIPIRPGFFVRAKLSEKKSGLFD